MTARPDAHQVTPYPLRLAPELRVGLETAAKANGRSLNAEILARLAAADNQHLRDQFAGLAMQSLMSTWGDLSGKPDAEKEHARKRLAHHAYAQADAMLEVRGATRPTVVGHQTIADDEDGQTGEQESLGERIAHLRAQKGMSQGDLALACGIAASQMSRYEIGRTKPRLVVLHKLAEALGTDVRTLTKGGST